MFWRWLRELYPASVGNLGGVSIGVPFFIPPERDFGRVKYKSYFKKMRRLLIKYLPEGEHFFTDAKPWLGGQGTND